MRLPHHEFFAGMPAGLIKDQQDPLRWACADGLGELRQRNREHIRPHGRQEQPLRLSGSRLHKTVDYGVTIFFRENPTLRSETPSQAVLPTSPDER